MPLRFTPYRQRAALTVPSLSAIGCAAPSGRSSHTLVAPAASRMVTSTAERLAFHSARNTCPLTVRVIWTGCPPGTAGMT
ncbi:MAG: hypothetical protein KatS3mg051_0967 [Anaerolineae bacterium]|nr:MAG: hypothetical protein KatS3mg051_0967 [Anaerolineae bacterium]